MSDEALITLMSAISSGDDALAARLLATTPELAVAQLLTGASRAMAAEFVLSEAPRLHVCRSQCSARGCGLL